MLLLIAIIAGAGVLLALIYTCGQFWFGSRYSPHGPVVSPHIIQETQRPKIITESAIISVWYRTDEINRTPSPVVKAKAEKNNVTGGDCEKAQVPCTEPAPVPSPEDPSPSTSTSVQSSSQNGSAKGLSSHLEKWKRIDAMQEKHKLKTWSAEQVGCDVVIGIHASKTQIGGYCLDLKNKVCEFYSYDIGRLEWIKNDEKLIGVVADTRLDDVDDEVDVDKDLMNEYSSKNLIFALLLWEDKLKEFKKFKLYTSNAAIRWPKSEHGRRIRDILTHLEDCGQLYKCNTMIVLEENSDLDKYVRYILPAKELSKLGIKMFMEYITGAYGIERFDGTHEYVRDETFAGKAARKALYMSTKYDERFVEKVDKAITNYTLNKCKKCLWPVENELSLKSVSSASKDEDVVQHGLTGDNDQIIAGKAPPSNSKSMSRKGQKSPLFPTLQWNRKNRDSGNSSLSTLSPSSKRRRQGADSSGGSSSGSSRRPTAPPPESSDNASTSTGASDHSDGYSTSKSTYSSKGTLTLR